MKGCILPILMITAVVLVFLNRHEIVNAFRSEPTIEPADAVAAGPRTDRDELGISDRVEILLRAELGALGLDLGDPIYLRIFKATRELEVWVQGQGEETFQLYKTFLLCPGSESPGPRVSESSRRAPEGFYYVAPRHLQSRSRHHFSFDLGYPNLYDRHQGRTGRGGMIHGSCRSGGSYGLTDRDVEELFLLAWHAFENGQPFFRVHCFPFRMTDERMDQVVEEKSQWLDFWANLKEGYDYFEIVGRPPNTTLKDGAYFFE